MPETEATAVTASDDVMMDHHCDPYVVRFHPKMTQAHVEGRKCCTTRRHPLGRIGQVFTDENLPGQQFRIITGAMMPLDHVRDLAYDLEGFASQEEFQAFWTEVYGSYLGESIVYSHWYAPVLGSALVLKRGGHDE